MDVPGAVVTPAEAGRVVETLKQICDPRGHELLDAIGQALITQAMAVERLDALIDNLSVEGHRVFDPSDNTQWSKRAELRSVQS